VKGFTVKSLFREDGSRFLPGNVQESSCYFDRILSPELRAALVEAAQSAILANRRGDPGSLFNAIFDATDDRLTEMFSSRSGVLELFVFMGDDLSISSPDNPHVGGPLEQDANSQGMYSERNVMVLLWLSYLDHLGVRGVRRAIQYAKSQESKYAPPSLKPAGCRGGIRYNWPIMYDAKDDLGAIEPGLPVHWGICTATGKPWMYQYKRGWRQASDDDVAFLCQHDPDEPFSEICRRR
jgi:hypothetical protein